VIAARPLWAILLGLGVMIRTPMPDISHIKV
jgi:hypothetical protein